MSDLELDLSTLVLSRGSHATPAEGMCALEAVARLAGERHEYPHDVDLIEGRLSPGDHGVDQVVYRSDGKSRGPWRSSLIMPRWASRTLGRITRVTIERVADITEEDAVREGFTMGPVPRCGVEGQWCHTTCAQHGSCLYRCSAREAFMATYAGIYAHKGQPGSLCVRVEWELMTPADVAELVWAQGGGQ